MADLIQPKVLKGFRDFLPSAEIERRNLCETLESVFRSYGFVPIDTPALEYAEILLGKGGGETEKQVYRFQDNGKRDVALRFDLTVPFARFMAEHRNELDLPFKRYHMAKVWRGENTQRGRYREFTQCDFDIVGSESLSSDLEIILMMRSSLKAIGAGDVKIHINHRGLFNRFLKHCGVSKHSVEILRTVDKLAKIGTEQTQSLLNQLCGEQTAEKILSYIQPKDTFEKTLEAMTIAAGGPAEDTQRLSMLYEGLKDAGAADIFTLDPSITRGLDYYTGIVYETFLSDMPEIGSVCSGGRYDNLASLYSKENLPGVGASIGLDRLLAALDALGRSTHKKGFADLAIACLDENLCGRYQALATRFRDAGCNCDVLSEQKKPVQQYTLAEKRGAKFVLSADQDALDTEKYTLRELASRQDLQQISFEDIVERLKNN